MRRLLPAVAADGSDVVEPGDLPAAYAYPPDATWLRANMIASVDGAATIAGRAGPLGNSTDQRLLGLLRALSDVVIAGSGTVITESYGPARAREEYQHLRQAAGQPPAPVMAVVSRELRLDFSAPYFAQALQPPLVITCAAAPGDRLMAAQQVADVVLAGDAKVEPTRMVRELEARGHRRLLCEGGPTLLAQLAAAGVLDEWCVTTSATVVGGVSPRILNGADVDPPSRLRLTQLLIDDDDMLYARYQKRTTS